MKQLLCMLLFCCITKSYATDYYFSSVIGDDNRSAIQAQNPATPWKTIQKLNGIFKTLVAGDKLYLRRGDTFEGTIVITKSGSQDKPIIFDAYGTGNKPVITGFVKLSGWSNKGNGIFETTNTGLGTAVNFLLVDNKPAAIGRYPNAMAANKGYLSFETSNKNISITDNQLSGSPNWSGAEVVIRKNRWVVDRNKISLHAGSVITYTSESHYNADPNYGYFIQNDPKTLDVAGEWYYTASQKKVGIFIGNANPGLVKASALNALVTCNSQSDISFRNIYFEGANENAFDFNRASRVSIVNCDIAFSGANAINALNSNYLTVEGTKINYSNNIALNFNNCSNNIIRNNLINATGIYTGMGKGDAGSYEAIMIAGNNNIIELNQIDSTGYIPVTFSGNSVTIKNNFISNFAFVKDDGGGIYTYNGSGTPQVNNNRKITGNIVINGLGAGEGTPDPQSEHVNGIYIDDKSNNVVIENNTIAFCARYGIYLHNANNISVNNNTVFDNHRQAGLVHDNNAASNPLRNIILQNNILFSKEADYAVAEFKTIKNDIGDFGNFDNNYYSRPFDDFLTINTSRKEGNSTIGKSYDVDGWKAAFSKDAHSKASPVKLKKYQLNNLIGSNKFANGAFNVNSSGLYTWSAAGNSKVSWSSNALDGGTLDWSFTKLTGTTNRALVVIAAGAVTANKTYLLKFSMKGGNEGKSLQAYLRKSLADYNDLSLRNNLKITASRTENEILFTANATESNASIVFETEEQQSPLYIDNIQLQEASVTTANINDLVRFEYNATASPKSIALNGKYTDVKNQLYSGSITLDPFSSVILMKQQGGAVADTAASFPGCNATGYLTAEYWNNIPGNNLSSIPVEATPSKTETISSLEIKGKGNDYGSRLQGYICAPATGNYIFYIAGDDAAELYLSSNDNPSGKSLIASVPSWTGLRQWNKFPSQKSKPIALKTGESYYIEVLHKQGNGDNHLSIAWQLPDGKLQAPLTGSYLSPFKTNQTVVKQNQTINFNLQSTLSLDQSPLNLSALASSGLPVIFSVKSGAATVNASLLTITGTGVVTLEATQAGNQVFNSATISKTLTVLPAAAESSCTAAGFATVEQWNNAAGNTIAAIPLQMPPTLNLNLNTLEFIDNKLNYGSRIQGYICAPQTGNYTFYIAGDDAAELWLSPNDSPDDKQRIARLLSWTNLREWNKYPSQTSAPVSLKASEKYYFSVLHKQGSGGGQVSVGWKLPDGSSELPVSGKHLSPYSYIPVTNLNKAAGIDISKRLK